MKKNGGEEIEGKKSIDCISTATVSLKINVARRCCYEELERALKHFKGRILRATTRVQKSKKGRCLQKCKCHDPQLKLQRIKGHMYSNPCHALFEVLNPLLIGILQVHYQGTNKSPFDKHPAILWAFLLATLVYCFALTADTDSQLCPTNFPKRFILVAMASGSFSSASLVAVFLPRFHGVLTILILWGAFAIVVARDFVKYALMWVYGRLSMVGSQRFCVWNVFTRSDLTDESPLPV